MNPWTIFVSLVLALTAGSASAQALPDSAWDEALQTRKACDGEIAVERERGLFLGTGKVLCEDLANRWKKSIAAQFGAATAELHAPLVLADVLVAAGYRYNRPDYTKKQNAQYVRKEADFGCTLYERAFNMLEPQRRPAPYSRKGSAFAQTALRRLTTEFPLCSEEAKALTKARPSLQFHKAAGEAQKECAQSLKALPDARLAMCSAGIAKIQQLFARQPEPTVLQRNSAQMWIAHAYLTSLEVKAEAGQTAEACRERAMLDKLPRTLALPISGFQSYLMRNIDRRKAALDKSCA